GIRVSVWRWRFRREKARAGRAWSGLRPWARQSSSLNGLEQSVCTGWQERVLLHLVGEVIRQVLLHVALIEPQLEIAKRLNGVDPNGHRVGGGLREPVRESVRGLQ